VEAMVTIDPRCRSIMPGRKLFHRQERRRQVAVQHECHSCLSLFSGPGFDDPAAGKCGQQFDGARLLFDPFA